MTWPAEDYPPRSYRPLRGGRPSPQAIYCPGIIYDPTDFPLRDRRGVCIYLPAVVYDPRDFTHHSPAQCDVGLGCVNIVTYCDGEDGEEDEEDEEWEWVGTSRGCY